jgi:ribosomal protein S3
MWDMNNLSEEIASANQYVYNLNKALIEQWCIDANVKEPIGFENDTTNHVMKIYTTKAGYLIGYEGKHIELFIERLKEAFFANEYTVEFIEIKGGIVNV